MDNPICKLFGGLEHVLFFHILGIIIPTDELIFFRGVETTNQQNTYHFRHESSNVLEAESSPCFTEDHGGSCHKFSQDGIRNIS